MSSFGMRCQALKEAQDCYLDGCDCNTECAERDKATGCPVSGKLSDPITFWVAWQLQNDMIRKMPG